MNDSEFYIDFSYVRLGYGRLRIEVYAHPEIEEDVEEAFREHKLSVDPRLGIPMLMDTYLGGPAGPVAQRDESEPSFTVTIEPDRAPQPTNGPGTTEAILALTGGACWAAIATALKAYWGRHAKKSLTVRSGNLEIRGYSADDVNRLIDRLQSDATSDVDYMMPMPQHPKPKKDEPS
ncbi:hypothetical protein [Haloglycomyces albus]|uniref:hypothetical protein n=1 Tax=Haloglycomyces albus TaxID=526067 RepID=UPI0012EC68B6|nr:hypothetical protein [Haloglycomyces albus]